MKTIFKITGLLVILLISFVVFKERDSSDLIDLINQELLISPSASGIQSFDLLDATQFTDLMYPWLGFPVTVISEKQLLGEGDHTSLAPNELKIKEVLVEFRDKKRIVLNLPSYQIKSTKQEDVLAALHIKWYLQVIQCVRDVLPNVDVGIMGLPYTPKTALKSTENILNYQQLLDYIKPVINATDTLYPVFKVFDYDVNKLSYQMGIHLYTAKTFGKPVYPVLTHKNTTILSDSDSQILPVGLIKQQCDFVRQNADGMVWWTSKKENWVNHWYEEVSEQCFF